MTKKEKVLTSMLREKGLEFANYDSKDLLKFIHTVNSDFQNLSIFSWFDKHGSKKTKKKIEKLFSKNEK